MISVTTEFQGDAKKPLDASDPHILNYGRKLNEEITAIDNDIDNGDGPASGRLWGYVCSGIDGDEGWQSRFIRKN